MASPSPRISSLVTSSRTWAPRMVREVASKTSDIAGDGTSNQRPCWHRRSSVEGAKAVAAGMNPMDLKRGIDKAVNAVVEELKKHTKKITTPAETAQVGAIAANGDTEARQDDPPKQCKRSATRA